MSPDEVRFLYDYTRWADDRALEAAGKLAPEQWARDMGSSMKSVRDTLVHLLSGQWMWLQRWKGSSPQAMWNAAEYPDVAGLKKRRDDLVLDQANFLSALTEESLKKDVKYTNIKGEAFSVPLWQLMLHAVNHSSYHRGQVTTLLRQLGGQPLSTDLVQFCGQKK